MLKLKLQYFGHLMWRADSFGTTQKDGMGREKGGGFRMGNTCIPVADSCWYMAKPIQYCKVKKIKLKKKTLNWKKKKRLWCWEGLKAGGEGMKEWTEDEMVGWDHWLNEHEFWVNSGRWWWTGRPGVLQSMGSQRFGHDWVTELFTVLHTQILESLMFHSSTVYSWLKVPIPLVIAFLEIVLWVQFFWERHNLLKRYRKELKP